MNVAIRRHAAVPALALAFAFAPIAQQSLYAQQLQPLNPPLRNWASPLYWAPTPAELEQHRIEQRIAHPDVSSSSIAQAASVFTAPGPMTFIALTPCRIMDTRSSQPFTGAFGPPSLTAYGTRQVPVPSSSCSVPANAGAYSLNITVVPPGALSFITVWPAGQPYPGVSTINDPVSGGVIANAAIVVAGTAGAIQVVAGNPTDLIIDINGYYASPTDGSGNTGIGAGALNNNSTGFDNTATGQAALASNTTGDANTATGYLALGSNTTGTGNTANGSQALLSNTTGGANTGSGSGALFANTTGASNTADGAGALIHNTTGSNNTASGATTLASNTTGSNNTAVGSGALQNATAGDNTALGQNTLNADTTGNDNTAVGQNALSANTTGGQNTASGVNALAANTTGSLNTAVGAPALSNNTTGTRNTAIGTGALSANTTGGSNTASGQAALFASTTGVNNTATGVNAMFSNTTGNGNTATGYSSMQNNTGGFQNTAVGIGALSGNTTGNGNIAVGQGGGGNLTTGSNNIDIGNSGVAGEGGVIRIGTAGTQNSFFVAGVSGVATGLASPVAVMIDTNGQLGTMSSSQRFKEDIQDMGDSSSGLMRLRPVTFRYKQPYQDGSKPIDYGLIAEEVADVYPDLVAYSPSGEVQTVQYQKVNAMLLNEVQKQHQQIDALNAHLAELQMQLEAIVASSKEPLK
jgi:hypothetical protein